jgi:plasmid stability protein
MPVQITVRNVPEQVRDELAARAKRQRQSMQEFLRAELEGIAARPSLADWLDGVEERASVGGRQVSPATILKLRDRDRK